MPRASRRGGAIRLQPCRQCRRWRAAGWRRSAEHLRRAVRRWRGEAAANESSAARRGARRGVKGFCCGTAARAAAVVTVTLLVYPGQAATPAWHELGGNRGKARDRPVFFPCYVQLGDALGVQVGGYIGVPTLQSASRVFRQS
eukprot:352476-Chlamydomonas_euryale.AAC.12